MQLGKQHNLSKSLLVITYLLLKYILKSVSRFVALNNLSNGEKRLMKPHYCKVLLRSTCVIL